MKTCIAFLGLVLLGAAVSHAQSSASIDPVSAIAVGPNLISISTPSQPSVSPQIISLVPNVTERILQEEAARPMISIPVPVPIPVLAQPPVHMTCTPHRYEGLDSRIDF